MNDWLFRCAAALAIITPANSARVEVADFLNSPQNISFLPLSKVALDTKPWENHEANSEQRHPVYMGSSPYDMVLYGAKKSSPELRPAIKALAEEQAQKIRKALKVSNAEFEIWPAQDDNGDQTWVFSRWRANETEPWKWLDTEILGEELEKEAPFGHPHPFLPEKYLPWKKADKATLFQDRLKMESLYDAPRFGDVVWTNAEGDELVGAWLPVTQKDHYQPLLTEGKKYIGYALPQVARFNDKPMSFVLPVSHDQANWPKEIAWTQSNHDKLPEFHGSFPTLPFSPGAKEAYRKNVLNLGGEKPTPFPISNHHYQFLKKSSAQPDHDLEKMADYFQEYYKSIDIPSSRRSFQYAGAKQSNVIAVLKGYLPPSQNRPILMADHYDTAFSEDIYNKTGKRVTTAGANDNVSATGILFEAAKVLKNTKHAHDIWLVHFTGEEYPSDDLGARHFVGELLKNKQRIGGLILLDMIGYRVPGDPVFQINSGNSVGSLYLSSIAMAAAKREAKGLTPVFRPRFDEKSYLYNTDGYIFSNLGIPVVFFNENKNRTNINSTNPHYHNSTDIAKNMDFDFAWPIGKAAILTLYQAAQETK